MPHLFDVCERFYARDGYVKWADVGAALGISRQAVQLRLRRAVEQGELKSADLERWQSLSSRQATARENRAASRSAYDRLTRRITFTAENLAWLQEEAAFRKMSQADIINGLINREREASKAQK